MVPAPKLAKQVKRPTSWLDLPHPSKTPVPAKKSSNSNEFDRCEVEASVLKGEPQLLLIDL